MTGEDEAMNATGRQIARQVRTAENRQLIRRLPLFKVEADLPDPFAKLLERLDAVAAPRPGSRCS